jgi:hypothetical protein
MTTKLTRRSLAGVLVSSPLLAQSAPKTPQDDLRAETESVRANSQKLSAYEIPMAAEPAFQFKA